MNNLPVKPGQQISPWEHLLLLTRALHAVLDNAAPALAELGLDPKGFFLLCVMDQHPGPAEVSRALMLPKPTTTALIKRAEQAGHLRRDTVPGDLRRFRLTLTPSGRAVMERGQEVLDAVMSQRLAGLSAAERGTLAGLLTRIIG